MKRKFSKIFAAFTACALIISLSVTNIAAETYWVLDYYKFTTNDKGGATLADYTNTVENLVVPETLLSYTVNVIGSNAFYQRTDITTVSLPETMIQISLASFYECTSLKEINFPSSLEIIGASAFQTCTSLLEADLSSTKLTGIYMQAFYNCQSLERVILPETCTSIADNAFSKCTSLSYIYIPESVTSISEKAFRNSTEVVIYGYSGSYAEQYAADNNIPFVSLSASDYELGDVNRDGIVNVIDVTLLQRYIVGIADLDSEQLKLADANGDGYCTVVDVTEIQRIIVNS